MKIAVKNALKKAYVSDNIGNRNSSTNNGVTTSYSANELNQYTNISNGVTNTPTFDTDGNMLTYDGWTYTWNGENRMVSATNSEHVISWNYDYMGRCFEKVKDGVTNSFVWNGYNIISEVSNSHTNFNVWGLDLSQSIQRAGGVCGLLGVVQDGAIYFTCMDGNGNICQYIDSSGTVQASREYSPFGETISYETTLPASGGFTHWWSTKPWDADAEMSEYELRIYLPKLGRWASWDLLQEFGGLNLYGFVENGVFGEIDFLGLVQLYDGDDIDTEIDDASVDIDASSYTVRETQTTTVYMYIPYNVYVCRCNIETCAECDDSHCGWEFHARRVRRQWLRRRTDIRMTHFATTRWRELISDFLDLIEFRSGGDPVPSLLPWSLGDIINVGDAVPISQVVEHGDIERNENFSLIFQWMPCNCANRGRAVHIDDRRDEGTWEMDSFTTPWVFLDALPDVRAIIGQ